MSWTDELASKGVEIQTQEAMNKKNFEDKFESLTPMVSRVINELALSLWGRTFFGAKKYHYYVSVYRWSVSQYPKGDSDSDYLIFVDLNTVTMDNFHVHVKNHRDAANADTDDCSEGALKAGLLKSCAVARLFPKQ